MLPHSRMGIRVRGCRRIPLFGGSTGGGKTIARGTEMAINAMINALGLNPQKIPFYKKLYTQGRRG